MPIIEKYKHATGFHCGSTTIRSMLRFYGHEVSEPMALGIGQGLFASYFAGNTLSPTHAIYTRSPDLEMVSLQGFGVEVTRRQTDEPEEAWQWVKQTIDGGEPLLLQVNLSDLPYYGTDTSFAGHKVIVFGYDEEAGTALISDNEFEEPQTITLKQLRKARISPQVPYDLRHNWFALKVPEKLIPLEIAIPHALRGQAEKMLQGPEYFGVSSLFMLAEKIDDWVKAKDWAWCARFTYQVIERRGSGGGGFRLKYADFLKEAEEYCPAVRIHGLTDLMSQSAATWTELAFLFKEISDQDSPVGFERAKPLLRRIGDLEKAFCERVMESCKS